MASDGSRKQITFDLCTDALKRHSPHQEPPLNPQYYNQAYYDIRRFMKEHGFEHRQSSAYVSAGRLTTLDIVILMEWMAAELPWLGRCVNEIDVADIGAQHSLKKLLETASRPLEVELGELPMETAAARPVRPKARSARRYTYARER